MGNKAGGQATQAVETVRKRLTIRRRNPQDESEFSALEIQRKFNNMPNLTEEEKKVLRSSWDIISQKVDQDGESRFLHKFESNQETEDPILQQFTQLDASIFNGKSAMIIVALTLENLENYQALWRNLIRLGRDHFGYGAQPMYLDLIGPHFVIAIRQTLGYDWYEALEYHWLALFELIVYVMKFGWHLQRCEVQKRSRVQSSA